MAHVHHAVHVHHVQVAEKKVRMYIITLARRRRIKNLRRIMQHIKRKVAIQVPHIVKAIVRIAQGIIKSMSAAISIYINFPISLKVFPRAIARKNVHAISALPYKRQVPMYPNILSLHRIGGIL